MSKKSLTPKQKAFIAEYLVDKNATRAAIAVGYSSKTARSIGSENLTKPNIAKAIKAGLKNQKRQTDHLTQEIINLRRITLDTYKHIIEMALTGTPKDLEKLEKCINASTIQIGIANSVLKAAKNGNWHTLDKMIERLCGKIPETVEVVTKSKTASMNFTIDYKLVKEAINELESEV